MNAIDAMIGRRLRELREERGLSADELAASLNTIVERIGSIERGEERLGAAALQRAAERLGVPVGTFFEVEGQSGDPSADHDPDVSILAREGAALNRAFASIADPTLRAEVVAHAGAVARLDARRQLDERKK